MKKQSLLSLLLVLAILLGACGDPGEEEKDSGSRDNPTASEQQGETTAPEEPTESAEPLGYLGVYEPFTDVVVKDETTALQAVAQAADSLGLSKPEEQLQVQSTMEYDDHTYYRMQRYCNDIPIYGKQVVLAAGQDGTVVAMTASEAVAECEATEPALDPQTAGDSLSFYFQDLVPAPESLTKEQLCYYPMEDGTLKLSYCLDLTESGFPYRVILDAVDGTVLHSESMLFTVDCYNADGSVRFDGAFDSGSNQYQMDNPNHNIGIYSLQGNISKNSSGQWLKEVLASMPIVSSSDVYFGNTDEEADLKTDKAITYMNNVVAIKEFFNDKFAIQGFGYIFCYYDDGYDFGRGPYSVYSVVDGSSIGIICFGRLYRMTEIDTITHEYMHLVENSIIGLNYSGESGAIKEAYSDIFAEIFEDYNNDGEFNNNCNWALHLKPFPRQIANPALSLNPTTYGDSLWGDPNDLDKDGGSVHKNSTVLSHAAYLMNKGTGGEPIGTQTLGRLWMNTLYLLQKNTDMHQLADTMIHVAHRMQKQGALTSAQLDAVYEAFYRTNLLEETVGSKMALKVQDADGNPYGSYYLTVYSNKTGSYIISEAVTTSEPYGLNLEKGRYTIIVADAQQKDYFAKSIKVDQKIEKTSSVSIITDFEEVNATRQLHRYVEETLIPQYGLASSFEYVGFQLFAKKSGTEIAEVLPDEGKGVISTHVEDLNGDSIPELLVVRMEGSNILTELYVIRNSKVVFEKTISINSTFQTYAETMDIFVIRNNGRCYLCIHDDGWSGAVGSTHSGTTFLVYRVEEDYSVVTEHKINLGTDFASCDDLTVNYRDETGWAVTGPDPARKQAVEDALNAVADKLGAKSLQPYWSSFPEDGDFTRIYSGGGSMDYKYIHEGKNDPENAIVFSTDYTGTAKNTGISLYGHIEDYGNDDGTLWILYEDGTLVMGSTDGTLDFSGWSSEWQYDGQVRKLIFDESVTHVLYFGVDDYTGLISVTIPASVTKITTGIDSEWLWDAGDLARIWVDPENPSFSADRRGCLYNKDGTVLLRVPSASAGSYRIADGVTTVGEGAFANCTGLSQVFVPASVTQIAEDAFVNCTAQVVMEADNAAYYNDTKGVLYSKDQKVLLRAPKSLSGSYEIPKGTEIIAKEAFSDCLLLTDVTISDSVHTIEFEAFRGCSKLSRITVPASVKYIDETAFDKTEMMTISYHGNRLQWSNIYNDAYTDPGMLQVHCEGKASEETAGIYAKYTDVVRQYEAKYGTVSFVEDEYDVGMIAGVCYLNLLDFDNDGKEELVLIYSIENDEGDIYYQMDIVSIVGTVPECIFSTALEWDLQWQGSSGYFLTSGDRYMVCKLQMSYNEEYQFSYLKRLYYVM